MHSVHISHFTICSSTANAALELYIYIYIYSYKVQSLQFYFFTFNEVAFSCPSLYVCSVSIWGKFLLTQIESEQHSMCCSLIFLYHTYNELLLPSWISLHNFCRCWSLLKLIHNFTGVEILCVITNNISTATTYISVLKSK